MRCPSPISTNAFAGPPSPPPSKSDVSSCAAFSRCSRASRSCSMSLRSFALRASRSSSSRARSRARSRSRSRSRSRVSSSSRSRWRRSALRRARSRRRSSSSFAAASASWSWSLPRERGGLAAAAAAASAPLAPFCCGGVKGGAGSPPPADAPSFDVVLEAEVTRESAGISLGKPSIPSNHGCCRHCASVNLAPGSIRKSPLRKLSAFWDRRPLYFRSSPSGRDMSGNLRPMKRGFLRKRSVCSALSGPSDFWMMYSWSMSDSPGKSGWPSTSSPIMQPIAHWSTAKP
mmetsp:Transcript_30757/g.100107  ORF Transcript_30757/g.100107 Transcript_30757/m.100107 type:complete len:288 (-) Transcript_30757:660-1523(-)